MFGYCLKAIAVALLALCTFYSGFAAEPSTVDNLLAECALALGADQEKAVRTLEKLRALQPTFSHDQNETFNLYSASSLGFRGLHAERVALVESFLSNVQSPVKRAKFLYHLIDGNSTSGRYEKALLAMNESIQLLPMLEEANQKMTVLQGAFALLHSLRAYEEAISFAERIYSLRGDKVGSYAACVGLTDKVELYFTSGNRSKARALVADAMLACETNQNLFFTLIIKTHTAIDLMDSANFAQGIAAGLPLFRQYSEIAEDSDYVTQLEEALARAYLKSGDTELAEKYGYKAYQRAKAGNVLELHEKTSETMAAIKRFQGQLSAAMDYYDINLALKKKVLDDQLHKNLAYQRVKFDSQDKANQLALLEQKNKNLSIEKALQQNKYQYLILLLTLGTVVLAILGAWLINTLRLKNIFRVSAQIDGLTKVSNRSHFTALSHQAFSDHTRNVSLVLFDMDFFKKVNDTYGHAAGDWVLKTVCSTVMSQLPKTALLGRLGGEEFALCLPNVQHEDEARALAERCRVAIAAINTAPSGFDFAITASFGVATRSAHLSDSFEETLVQADKALYLSKNEGRNRVTTYQPSGAHSQ